jgi:hypothetical protein
MAAFADKALPYASLGWFLIPQGRSKVPMIPKWPTAATNDPREIAEWDRQFPTANVAVVTGQRSGVVVVDLDGPEAQARWLETRKICGMQRDPPTVITRRGVHLYYRSMGVIKSATPSKLGKGIDIRGENALATLPTSVHESGHRYEWEGGFDRDRLLNLPLMTPSCLNMINGRDPFRDKPLKTSYTPSMDSILKRLRTTPEGSRNRAVYNAAFRATSTLVKSGELSEIELHQLIMPEGLALGLPRVEVITAIRSGYKDGIKS